MFDSISDNAKELIFILTVFFWMVVVAAGMFFAFAALFNAKQYVALTALAIVLAVLPVCVTLVHGARKKGKKG